MKSRFRPIALCLLVAALVILVFLKKSTPGRVGPEPNENPAVATGPAAQPIEGGDYQVLVNALHRADLRSAQLEARVSDLERRLALLEGRVNSNASVVLDLNDSAPTNTSRPWGPEQATGAPNTWQAGDLATAWASRSPDAGEEWLQLTYANAVVVDRVRVRETFNPGAISRVTAIQENGIESTLWEGDEPQNAAPVEVEFTAAYEVTTKTIKVYLDTSRVPGWNEIDAVELIGRDGSRQWASQATASSTYADAMTSGRGQTGFVVPDYNDSGAFPR